METLLLGELADAVNMCRKKKAGEAWGDRSTSQDMAWEVCWTRWQSSCSCCGYRGTWTEKTRFVYACCSKFVFICRVPSVLWHCWLGGRKGIRPVKKGGMVEVGTC